MRKTSFKIAVYVDMENVASSEFSLEELMNGLMKADEDQHCTFVIKVAYGNQSSAKKLLKNSLSIITLPLSTLRKSVSVKIALT